MRIDLGQNVVGLQWKPAERKQRHNDHQHLDHLCIQYNTQHNDLTISPNVGTNTAKLILMPSQFFVLRPYSERNEPGFTILEGHLKAQKVQQESEKREIEDVDGVRNRLGIPLQPYKSHIPLQQHDTTAIRLLLHIHCGLFHDVANFSSSAMSAGTSP